MAKFAKSIQDLTDVRKRHLLEAEQDAVKLAIAVARQDPAPRASVDPEALLGVVKAAFERVEARDVHRIRLHPEDAPTLQRHLVAIGMPPRVELVADTSLERGSVIVETESREPGRFGLFATQRDRARAGRPSAAEFAMDLDRYLAALEQTDPVQWTGEVSQLIGLLVESEGPAAAIGDFCEIRRARAAGAIRTQVIGFRDGRVLSMPLEETDGLQLGDRIVARNEAARVAVGKGLLGRVLDGFGKPMDGKPPIDAEDAYDLFTAPPGPLEREPIDPSR